MRLIVSVIMICASVAGGLIAADDAVKIGKTDVNRKAQIVQLEAFPVDEAFVGRIAAADPFRRDQIIASRIGILIESTATVKLVEEYSLYKKKYHIVAKMESSSGVTVQYHIYTDNAEYLTFLSEGQKFAFKGQFVMATPVNSKRDYYIFDVILQEGAAVIE